MGKIYKEIRMHSAWPSPTAPSPQSPCGAGQLACLQLPGVLGSGRRCWAVGRGHMVGSGKWDMICGRMGPWTVGRGGEKDARDQLRDGMMGCGTGWRGGDV